MSSNLLTTLTTFDIWLLAKALVVFFLLMYVGFSFMIIRQISLMVATLGSNISPFLKMAARFHLAFAIIILGLSLVIL